MQFKQLIALAYAITAAAVAIQLMSAYTQTVQQQFAQKTIVPTLMPEPTPTNPVVMMSRQVPLGQKLSASDLKLVLWPASIAPKGAFRSIEDVFAARPEQFSKAALVEGEVLLDSKLSATGEGSSLSMMLPAEMRAVTIQINEVLGVGGFVRPGDTVDILLTESTAAPNKSKPRATRVILQNVRILAMGQELNASKTRAKVANSATLAVTLEGAQKLALASTMGVISMALRNPHQTTASGHGEVSLKDLQPKKPRSGKMEVVVHRAAGKSSADGGRTKISYRY